MLVTRTKANVTFQETRLPFKWHNLVPPRTASTSQGASGFVSE
ncbi:MAG: hypothetical protein ABSG14_03775 [Verrucomicrobiia bacterium]|jgi:hypothetical protein